MADVIIRGKDEISGTINSIRNANKGLNKDFEETSRKIQDYQKRQEALDKVLSKTQTAMVDAQSAVKKAKDAYAALGSETNKTNLEKAYQEQNRLTTTLKEQRQAAADTSKAIRGLRDEQRKAGNESGGSGGIGGSGGGSGGIGGSSTLEALMKSGLTSMVGDAVAGAADVGISSAFGSTAGSAISSLISGAASGAAMGSLGGPVGTAIGAAVGGVAGAINGAAQVFGAQDDAFKENVQTAVEGVQQRRLSDQQTGSQLAGQRETDALAFNSLLHGKGNEFLGGVRTLAASTPFAYSDLTAMGRSMATGFGDDPDRMLSLMRGVGDAGAAVGASSSDMQWMGTALSRMQNTNLAQLGEINMFQDRGVNVIGMLSTALSKTEGEVRKLISGGKLMGRDVVDIIQAGLADESGPYAGAMEAISQTFQGLTSTLEDTRNEILAEGGQEYNTLRSAGMREEINALSGSTGTGLSEMNSIITQGKAYQENLKEQFLREASGAVVGGTGTTLYDAEQKEDLGTMREEYKTAQKNFNNAVASGDTEAAAKFSAQVESVRGEMESYAESAYEASTGMQAVKDVQLDMISAIRDNTAALGSASWNFGYNQQQELSKGMASRLIQAGPETTQSAARAYADRQTGGESSGGSATDIYGAYGLNRLPGYAVGLGRVPYDGFPAILHEGERVKTASQARAEDAGVGRSITIAPGAIVVQGAGDPDAVARSVARELRRAILLAEP